MKCSKGNRSKRETQEEEKKRENQAFKQDNVLVKRKDFSSVSLCSMRENPMRINLSPGDEGFTCRNILQITSLRPTLSHEPESPQDSFQLRLSHFSISVDSKLSHFRPSVTDAGHCVHNVHTDDPAGHDSCSEPTFSVGAAESDAERCVMFQICN